MYETIKAACKVPIIGVTGGSGAGKTAFGRALARLGGYVIDTDNLSHEIILSGRPAYNEILAFAGSGVLDSQGEIDRKALGSLVFSHKEKLDRLTKLVHKRVIEESLAIISRVGDNPGNFKFIVIDAPLLFEAGMDAICHQVWGIFAPRETRLRRIMARDGISREKAETRLLNQILPDKMLALVHCAVYNSNEDEGEESLWHMAKGLLKNEFNI